MLVYTHLQLFLALILRTVPGSGCLSILYVRCWQQQQQQQEAGRPADKSC